jgi:quinol monooxygenase YgiN
MATILAQIQVHPGRERDFERVAAALHQATHETETRVRAYEYWRGEKPGFYYCLLAFDDFLAFLTHQTSDHHEAASRGLGELIEHMRLEWVDPVAGASKYPRTDMQDLPEDASDLTRRYHRIFAAVVQEWWGKLRD